jgi:hypothetical protein
MKSKAQNSEKQLQREADRRNISKVMRQKDPSKLLPAYWVVRDGKLALVHRAPSMT